MLRITMISALAAFGVFLSVLPTAQAKQIKASAITAQIVPVDQKKPAIVEIVTIVEHPARVTVKSVKTPKNIKLHRVNTTSCTKTNKVGQRCKQRHKMMLNIRKVCRLNGTYTVMAAIACKPGAKGTCNKASETIELTLKSENFCEGKTINVPK